jgi:hypothetical protein
MLTSYTDPQVSPLKVSSYTVSCYTYSRQLCGRASNNSYLYACNIYIHTAYNVVAVFYPDFFYRVGGGGWGLLLSLILLQVRTVCSLACIYISTQQGVVGSWFTQACYSWFVQLQYRCIWLCTCTAHLAMSSNALCAP